MRYKSSNRFFSSFPQESGDRRRRSDSRRRTLLRRLGLFLVTCVDRFLRHHLHICEFTERTDCVLRISKSLSRSAVTLLDGSEIRRGDPLLELHLWNEHLSSSEQHHPTLAWGHHLLRRLHLSLTLLANYVEQEEQGVDIRAVHARFATCLHRPERAIRQLGFSIISPRRSFGRIAHDFFENFLIYGLMWAFRPCGLKLKAEGLKRMELWISKADLQKVYGRSGMGHECQVSSASDAFSETCDLPKGSQPEAVAGT